MLKGIAEYGINISKMKEYRDECVNKNLSHLDSHNLLRLIKNGSLTDVYA